jgi:drug/metabolite transporter (DMT)-like permease
VQREAALGVAGIALAWGAIGLFVRWVDLPAVAIVASRCALAALAIGLFLGAARLRTRRRHDVERDRWPRRAPWWALVGLGLLLAAHWLFLVGAQQRAPLGTVLLITYLAPVLVTSLAARLLGEAVPGRTYVAALVGLAGVAVLVRPGAGGGVGAGEGLALLAAVSYAAITLGSKRVVGAIGGVRLAFVQLLVAALALAPLALATDWGPARADWWWLVLLGVVMTGLLGSVYLVLLDRLPAATVSVLTYLEPVSAVLVGWVFLDEVPTVTMVAGGVLVVAAGIMVLPRAAQQRAAPERSVPGGAPR